MPPDRGERRKTAISNLVSHMVPKLPGEDKGDAKDRQDRCFEAVYTILNK